VNLEQIPAVQKQLTVTLTVAALASALAATCHAGSLFKAKLEGGNLFQNGGFEKSAEDDLSNWIETAHGSAGGSLTVVKDELATRSGINYVVLQALPHGCIGVMQGSRVFPGKRYVTSFHVRGEGEIVLTLHFYRLDGYHLGALQVPEGYTRQFVFGAS
jgi:hypothetical protein